MSDRVLMEEMSWPQVRDALAAGRRTAVIPCGSFEQHGPHLPLGSDAMLAEAIAIRAAVIAGNTLVAPTVRPALSEHHMGFPATITLEVDTFVHVLRDYVASLAKHGFARIVIFTSHGGNEDVLRAYTPIWAKQVAPQCAVSFAPIYQWAADARWQLLSNIGVGPAKTGVHAGYSETSTLLALRPDLVAMDSAEKGFVDDAFYVTPDRSDARQQLFVGGTQALSPIGVLGDPRGADRVIGERLLALVVDVLAMDLSRHTARTPVS